MIGEPLNTPVKAPAPIPQSYVRDNSISLSAPPKIVVKILMGTLQACSRQNAKRLTMSDICLVSGVSRGTLYKYFKTKDNVLAALTEYLTLQFETGIHAAADSQTDPLEKFRAVLAWHDHFSSLEAPDRLVFSEPEFSFGFLRDNFHRHTQAMQDALSPSFDHFDSLRGQKIDRAFFSELIIRIQQSRLLLPAFGDWRQSYAQTIANLEGMLCCNCESV
ncbi:MAG: TetR family transcriptional regulator [Robiginitomaculum sp.]|nr:MAG: TetR family transcriptional regulator [Robiginitomaculum sp.]